jgi:hypothetical protein
MRRDVLASVATGEPDDPTVEALHNDHGGAFTWKAPRAVTGSTLVVDAISSSVAADAFTIDRRRKT